MAINTLPLLPPGFPRWDWTASNGNASAAQTQAAYRAITNEGLCRDFSRLVWNDIVDLTATMVSTAGLTWDDTYGSAASCKINEPLGILTAPAFNAVALNVKQLDFVKWKWSLPTADGGYVGRDDFHGVSTHQNHADLLYGWHLKELTYWLNFMISFLDGSAAVAAESKATGVSRGYADITTKPSLVVIGSAAALSRDAAHVTAVAVLYADGFVYGRTLQYAKAAAVSSVYARSKLKSVTLQRSKLYAGVNASMRSVLKSVSAQSSTLETASFQNIGSSVKSVSGSIASIMAGAYILFHGTARGSTKTGASLEKPSVSAYTADGKGVSAANAEMTVSSILKITVSGRSTSKAKADMQQITSIISLAASTCSASRVSAALSLDESIWYDPIQTNTNVYIRSVADPNQTGGNVYIGRE